ncbi:hypothetical protein M153_20614000630, partial [Pseudoloma neurophilia]
KKQKMVKQALPRYTRDLSENVTNSFFSFYKNAYLLKTFNQPHFSFIFINLLLLIIQFYIFSTFLSIIFSKILNTMSFLFSIYFSLLYFSFLFLSSLLYKYILELSNNIINIMTSLSFTLFYLPITLTIGYMLGPLSFIFVFAMALINNYYVLLLLQELKQIESQRTYFFISLTVLIAAFLMCYGGQALYYSGIELIK